MLNGIAGIPGSGKSYEAAAIHVLAALKRGRKVITNLPLNIDAYAAIDPAFRDLIEVRTEVQPVRGEWDATRSEAFQLWPVTKHKKPAEGVNLFGHVWDWWSDWKHPVHGFGPLFIVDECHVAMPSRKHGKTDPQVVQWFKLHRHFNIDVTLMTQNFRDVDDSICGLMATLIKVRKADIVGKPGYLRIVFSGYRGGEMSREERQYDPTLFQLYRSHTQGGAVAEFAATDVKSRMVGWRRRQKQVFMLAGVLALGTVGLFVFGPKPEKKAVEPKIVRHAPTPQPRVQSAPQQAARPVQQPVQDVEPKVKPPPEPYGGSGIHLTGAMSMGKRTIHTFTVSQNGAVTHALTNAELERSGYKWTPYTECSGLLEWRDKQRAITCSTPQVTQGIAGVKTGG